MTTYHRPTLLERLPAPAGRVVALADLPDLRARWSADGARVVLTNGCFDLLHVGHVRYLTAARALGDVLVVALNDDAGVRRLKGPDRPLQSLADRAEILAALRAVDVVVPFADATAVAVLRALRPDVYVKGGDYGPDVHRPPEADVALALGATVLFLPLVAGRSTTRLVARVREPGA